MSSMKTNAVANERATLNTTIRKEVLDEFKAYCKQTAYPMSMVLEAFMQQFVTGEFTMKIARANRLTVDLVEENNDNID